jgi:hypothetical protein
MGNLRNHTRRDPRIAMQILEIAGDLMRGKKTGTFDPGIEEHVIEQLGSSLGPSKLRIKIDYVSTVTSEGKVAGIVVVERAWPADS